VGILCNGSGTNGKFASVGYPANADTSTDKHVHAYADKHTHAVPTIPPLTRVLYLDSPYMTGDDVYGSSNDCCHWAILKLVQPMVFLVLIQNRL
jgi:hypothetical protein